LEELGLMRRTWWVLVTKVHPQEARGGIALPPVTSLLLLFPLLLLLFHSLLQMLPLLLLPFRIPPLPVPPLLQLVARTGEMFLPQALPLDASGMFLGAVP
jgi:hypothetical protein